MQIFTLPFWKKISPWFRFLPGIIFYTVAILVYALYLTGGLSKLWETVTIPFIQYVNMLLAWLVLYIYISLENRITCNCSFGKPSSGQNALYLCVILVIYALLMLSSVVFNYVEINFLILMEINIASYLIFITATIMLHKRIFGPHKKWLK